MHSPVCMVALSSLPAMHAAGERRGGNGGCCGRSCREGRPDRQRAVAVAAAGVPRRRARGRGRPPHPVAAGFLRDGDRALLHAQSRAAVVAWCRSNGRRPYSRHSVSPPAGVAQRRDRARLLRGRARGHAAGAVGARRADAGAPSRAGRADRARHRCRSAGPGLARHRRARSVAGPRRERAAAPRPSPPCAEQRRVAAGRPAAGQGDAVPGAGAGIAGRPRHAARTLLRRHRRCRL